MVAYSFQKQFAAPILERTKGGTIRAIGRRRHARPGDALQLYTAMRTKHCKLISRETCLATAPIRLDFRSRENLLIGDRGSGLVELAGARQLDAFARFDGFGDWAQLREFWREVHEALRRWRGVHIRWLDLPDALRP
jgi:hypothetical protein